jgi:AraC-like DNA-binding protein
LRQHQHVARRGTLRRLRPRQEACAVKIAATLEAYLARPVGHCVAGSTYAVWWRDASLNGILLWGRPEEDHVHRLTRAVDAELAPGVCPHASLIDARRVDSVDLGAFRALVDYVHSRGKPLSRIVTRQAIVRPEGLAGAAVAGFYAVFAPMFPGEVFYPVNVFVDPHAALDWLGVEHATTVLEEVDGIHRAAVGDSPFLVSLRSYLDRRSGPATLKAAAVALGVSPRSLQRRLHEKQTSFQREANGARVRVAKALLSDTMYDMKRIAIEVGCSSLPQFSRLFRKITGETPTSWRERSRGARGVGAANAAVSKP